MDEIVAMPPERAGELWTLQRACWVTEAQLTGSVWIPPLTQTFDELRDELTRVTCLAVFRGHRLIGSVRRELRGDALVVNRLMVAPDLQGHGLGARLLAAIESGTDATRAELFTGAASTANLRFYAAHGYRELRREVVVDVDVVHLGKPLG